MTSLVPTPDAGVSAYAGSWLLDPTRTTVAFHTKAMWVLPVKGTADAREGGGQVDEDGTVQGRLVIDATSIATGMKKRDAHLQTADFFNTPEFPTINFELASVTFGTSGRVTLGGNLTILGNSQPVTFEADVKGDATSATIDGTIDDLDRRNWGVTWAKMGASVHSKIVVHATFIRA